MYKLRDPWIKRMVILIVITTTIYQGCRKAWPLYHASSSSQHRALCLFFKSSFTVLTESHFSLMFSWKKRLVESCGSTLRVLWFVDLIVAWLAGRMLLSWPIKAYMFNISSVPLLCEHITPCCLLETTALFCLIDANYISLFHWRNSPGRKKKTCTMGFLWSSSYIRVTFLSSLALTICNNSSNMYICI